MPLFIELSKRLIFAVIGMTVMSSGKRKSRDLRMASFFLFVLWRLVFALAEHPERNRDEQNQYAYHEQVRYPLPHAVSLSSQASYAWLFYPNRSSLVAGHDRLVWGGPPRGPAGLHRRLWYTMLLFVAVRFYQSVVYQRIGGDRGFYSRRLRSGGS